MKWQVASTATGLDTKGTEIFRGETQRAKYRYVRFRALLNEYESGLSLTVDSYDDPRRIEEAMNFSSVG